MRLAKWTITCVLLFAGVVDAGDETAQSASDPTIKHINLPAPTLGGKQYWADELLFRGYRIQRNVLTGHYRLLDGQDIRRVWGTYEQCVAALDEIKRRDKLSPLSGKVVIVLHGLGRTRSSLSGMAKFLEQNGDYTVLAVSYPSTMAEVEEHAKSLGKVIENLEGIDEIDFVAHSLGNLVIRRLLYDQLNNSSHHTVDPRIKRIVMLGAPNNGAQLAVAISRNSLARELIGVPGRELADGWAELSTHLATPPCEFGVIAGGKATIMGIIHLLNGDNDLIVTVEETRLRGARDFLRLPVMHTFLMDDPRVQIATLSFLNHGYFIADNQRHPIEEPPQK